MVISPSILAISPSPTSTGCCACLSVSSNPNVGKKGQPWPGNAILGEGPTREAAMFARVAVWSPMPREDRQWVIDAAKSAPGVLDAYHLVDEGTGDGLSIETIYRVVRRG